MMNPTCKVDNETVAMIYYAQSNMNEEKNERVDDVLAWLTTESPDELFAAAYAEKCARFGKRVALRGLIEFSNICGKNCFYCGIRGGNQTVSRYRMTEEEIVSAARWASEANYGSVVLQSGEIVGEENTAFVERVLKRIHAEFGDTLGITLCLGEQDEEVYRRWLEAGAHRYLLRIETSNPKLYAKWHPENHSWYVRRDSLRTLKRLGYIVGSGVMIGAPGQTVEDLASDIKFFKDEDLDMIGMGPYIPHPDTPMGAGMEMTEAWKRSQVELTLRMIAAARLYLKDVNIAATTALQALDPVGREKGIQAGANVVMPNVTPMDYRRDYRLYADKPCLDESSDMCRGCLERRLSAIGETIEYGKRSDSPHYLNRKGA